MYFYSKLSKKKKLIKQIGINARISQLLWWLKRIVWLSNAVNSLVLIATSSVFFIFFIVALCFLGSFKVDMASIQSILELMVILVVFVSIIMFFYLLTKWDWFNKFSLFCLCIYGLELLLSYVLFNIHKLGYTLDMFYMLGFTSFFGFASFDTIIFLSTFCSAVSGILSNLIKLIYKDKLITVIESVDKKEE